MKFSGLFFRVMVAHINTFTNQQIYEFTNNREVVPFITKAERFHGHLIDSTNPAGVENNVCFLVHLDQLQEPEDLLPDDLGFWNQSKTANHRKGRPHYEDYKTS